ncbi:hypothetical protein BBAD15_g7654 [Beauveria bassiana D1-5]|uniref:Uncharacterized protein n=1 Tax=Beauveria bassiana D1-5 TaxID=1245745 RepID=A0A0A2VGL1_BEABA|nr:hypothetical protein BBAD15_g7654 [Beauveria bassiana D1-5]
MDALAALSLASTLMQFADYGSKLLSQAPHSYKTAHGEITDDINVETLVQDLLSLQQSLKRQAPPKHVSAGQGTNTENITALRALYSQCMGAVQELLAHLPRLKTRPTSVNKAAPQRKSHGDKWRSLLGADSLEALDSQQQPEMLQFRSWDSFHKALRAIWDRQEMEALEDSLWQIRRDVQFRMLVLFRGALCYLASQRSRTFHELKRFTTRILDAFYNSEDSFISMMQSQTKKILQLSESDKGDGDDDGGDDGGDDMLGLSVGDILHTIGSLQVPEQGKNSKAPPLTNVQLENEVRSLISETYVLESLSFATMIDRRESVEKSHARTFDWIYKDAQNAQVPWSSFVNWLRHGDGIYWINGKVGSGKSTLMRHLYENKTTQRELETWAADYPCQVYSFFFWNSGAEDQKSQRGLLRSLLFDILQRHRSLMPQVMLDVWKTWSARAEAVLKDRLPYDTSLLPLDPEPMTVAALKRAFQVALESLAQSTKLCFFIDGLDEYGAEHSEIISLATQCAVLPNIKFCLSSRPLQVFEEAFSGIPTLRLQDLTHGDLSHYVVDRLYSQPRMQQLSHPEAAEVSHLIQETVTKSQGVFLWVKLVVRSLVYELPKYNSIADLQRQVDGLPGELDDLFAHMVASKDHTRASQILQVFQLARKQSPEKITLLQLSFADEEDELLAEEAPMQKITIDEVASRCQDMDSKLHSICAGLLESHDAKYSSMAPNRKVLFLHRTVSDWIAQPSVWAALISQTAATKFSPSLALLKSSILQLKGLDISPARPFNMGIIVDAVAYAREAETELGAGFPKLFDQLDLATAYQWRLGDCCAVYGGDDMSDASSDTTEGQSDKSASPTATPSQLSSYLQSYRASMIDSQSGIFSTLNLGGRTSRDKPSGLPPAIPENRLAASYIAHAETRFGGRAMREQPPQKRTPPRETVGTTHHHWAWCLKIPDLIPLHAAGSFYDVARLAGMEHYVAAKDASANVLDQDVGQHLLMRAVASLAAMPATGDDSALVAELLAGGADPNFSFHGQSPWEAALAAAASHFASSQGQSEESLSTQYRTGCENWIEVMGLFLRHDADPYAQVKVLDVDDRLVVSIHVVLESYVPQHLEDEVEALMELLLEKRAEFDKKQAGRMKRSTGVDIEGKTPVSSAEWPMSWIPIRNSIV